MRNELECCWLVPALVNVVLNKALSFNRSVALPGALALQPERLDRLFHSLLPLCSVTDTPADATIQRMRLSRTAGLFDLTFLSQHLAISSRAWWMRPRKRNGTTGCGSWELTRTLCGSWTTLDLTLPGILDQTHECAWTCRSSLKASRGANYSAWLWLAVGLPFRWNRFAPRGT